MGRMFLKYRFGRISFFLLIVGCIAGCSGNNGQADSTNDNADTKIAAKNLFEQKCIACHGNDGTAGIAGAANLQTISITDEQIVQSISNGKGNMPAFKDMLSQDDINAVKDYVKGLHK